jgi:hypothetical protein
VTREEGAGNQAQSKMKKIAPKMTKNHAKMESMDSTDFHRMNQVKRAWQFQGQDETTESRLKKSQSANNVVKY